MARAVSTISPEQLRRLFDNLRHYARGFQAEFGDLDPKKKLPMRTEAAAKAQWELMARSARVIRHWIVDTRAIPRGKAKAVELAYRAFEVQRPRNVIAWWKKNHRHVAIMVESEGWPERSTGGEVPELLEIGPFVIHNTVHLTGKQLDRTLDVIKRATKALKSTGPDLSRVLYGDVFIVGQLRVPRTVAWYHLEDDTIYLRPMPKIGDTEILNLIHELGHRYWAHMASAKDRSAWVTHHNALARVHVHVAYPKVGDKIPVRGHEKDQEILEIRYLPGLRDPQAIMESGGRVPVMAIYRSRELEERRKLFPSRYAMKDAEEHFADAFAMHVLGTLPPEHEQVFEEWLESAPSRAANPLLRLLTGFAG